MKQRTAGFIAAAFAAGAIGAVSAQQATQPTSATAGDPPVTYVSEPIASIGVGARGPNVEMANAIVQALAADPSLKQSKLTVLPEEEGVLITGVTPTLKQMAHISNVASQHANGGKVVNIVVTEEMWLEPVGVGTTARRDGSMEPEAETAAG